jgi:GDP/UDP-N,N'-diacetylbacillosamine 2-epimerase (hydrolysing)
MKIIVLTSSRADYSILLPLLKELKNDTFFNLNLLVFGSHLSSKYGETIKMIEDDGFFISGKIKTLPDGDKPIDISESIGNTICYFSKIWEKSNADLVIAIGDRYEMFAACIAALPFGIHLAHIHGGEKTLGAIDEVFRHSITHMAKLHFVTTDEYFNNVVSIKGTNQGVYKVGALSLDNLKKLKLYSVEELKHIFGVDVSIPSILITFHPETVDFKQNQYFIDQLISALDKFKGYQYLITMPNADTMGQIIRERFIDFSKINSNAIIVESFGTIGYISCMKHCSFMLGNSSSGFVEASYFSKYVINLGNRQKGRIITKNIVNCKIEKNEIIREMNNFKKHKTYKISEFYGDGNTASRISQIIKNYYIEKF